LPVGRSSHAEAGLLGQAVVGDAEACPVRVWPISVRRKSVPKASDSPLSRKRLLRRDDERAALRVVIAVPVWHFRCGRPPACDPHFR
jgi:hypothetical protein